MQMHTLFYGVTIFFVPFPLSGGNSAYFTYHSYCLFDGKDALKYLLRLLEIVAPDAQMNCH